MLLMHDQNEERVGSSGTLKFSKPKMSSTPMNDLVCLGLWMTRLIDSTIQSNM